MKQWMSGRSVARGAAVTALMLISTLAIGGTAGAKSSSTHPHTHPPTGYKLDAAAPRTSSERIPQSGAYITTKQFSWKIPALHYVRLPDWTCPSATPFFKSNGKHIELGHNDNGIEPYQRYQADIRVDASEGVGYKGILAVKGWLLHVRDNENSAGEDPRVMRMFTEAVYPTGFHEGTWYANSVWAPPFKDGTFKMEVTCTSSRTDAAFVAGGFKYHLEETLPWKE